jgi:hypothetical protein
MIQSPHLWAGEFESHLAKRLLQQYRSKAEVAALRQDVCFAPDTVAKVVLPMVSKILRAAGAVFV